MAAAVEVDITDWETIQLEARGSGPNQWRQDPDGVRWLYKATRVATHSGELQGEDWAEKVSERLAQLLGLPCAVVELAYRRTDAGIQPGVISRDLVGSDTDLQNGANLLGEIPGYRYRDSAGRPPRNHIGHSVANVVRQLRRFEVAAPVELADGWMTAVDVFAGYLVLDAWIGNLDRHEENWAVLRHADGRLSLAPSYDHGAALGSSLTEARREALADDPARLATFAAKGFGLKFEDGAKVPLTSFAADALDAAGLAARQHWLSRLADVRAEDCREAVAGIARMSDPARSFCEQLLMINQRRVLDVCG